MVEVKGEISGGVTQRLSVVLVELFGVEESLLLWVYIRVDEVVDLLVFRDFVLAEYFFDEELEFDVISVQVREGSDETVNNGLQKLIHRKQWFQMG